MLGSARSSHPPTATVGSLMRKIIRLAMIAPIFFLTACGAPYWKTSTFDQFPINRGSAARGTPPIKVIALVPGGGDVADSIGVELAKRGFVIVPAASTIGKAAGVDFKAVSEHHIPARRNPGEIDKLRGQLLRHGVDAFLIVQTHDFNPRQWRDNPYWQQASYQIYSTLHSGIGYFGYVSYGQWANIDKHAKGPSEAAVEIVNSMAQGPGAL